MPTLRVRILLPVAALLLAAAVWATASVQRSSATSAAERVRVANDLLTAMLDQETGLRGFQLTGEAQFLAPFHAGRRRLEDVEERASRHAAGDRELVALVAGGEALGERWYDSAVDEVTARRHDPRHRAALAEIERRKRLMDAYRAANRDLRAALDARRETRQRRAGLIAAVLCALIFMLVGGVGTLLVARRQRADDRARAAEDAYRASQDEYVQTLQAVSSEDEANALLKRHLERVRPGREVAVLNRNNSDNRLEVRTVLPADATLSERLAEATPSSCVAVRLARPHEETPDAPALLECELCGGLGDAACSPLTVSGRVIGSVLVRQDEALTGADRRRVAESVSQAAPVLGNLRAVAMAESRAATDALTGLPNRRAIDDTLVRMVAHAHRVEQPLAVLALDLDHFKDINDRFGHEKGDIVLATVAAVLGNTIRASDFAGRLGGEEFVVFGPNTSADGALVLAEKIRDAVASVDVLGVNRDITISIGYAVLPDDASDGESLLRKADRALYAAKGNGRDRVEAFVPAPRPA
jgi:diguanylate cyclase (GGDEF)-like protein